VFVQVGLGVALMTAEDIEPPDFHMLYGFAGIITVGIVYSYRDSMREKRCLLYGFGGLFLMGLGIRALMVRT
jgi:hypothetical protein